MTTRHHSEEDIPFVTPLRRVRWKRLLGAIGVPVLLFFLLLLILWNTFFHYVPPGKMLVITSKNGDPMPAGEVLADEGQKGIQKKVLGEGWHYVTPIIYTTELKDNTIIKPGHVGIVTSKGGKRPSDGGVLTYNDDEQGIRHQVLLPGAYRINPYGYSVEEVRAVEIKPGFVGVQRRLLGKGGQAEDRGILREVLQPGLYYLNTKEFEVIPCEVGIYQTTYHYEESPQRSTAITFPARDGNIVHMECTIEWEVQPRDWPHLVAVYGSLTDIEQKVIDQHAKKISRERGFNYRVQEFLDGGTREKFQTDFTQELEKACKEKKVEVRSAFIRNMVIPDNFLKPKRDRQVAVETALTSQAKTETAQTNAKKAEAKGNIEKAEAKVKAETERLVAGIDRKAANVQLQTDAAIEALKQHYGAQIAEKDNERTQILGEAEAKAKAMTETAKSRLYKMKMDLFQNDGNAFLRYTLAKDLNPKIVLRLFHSGPGTFWTNLGDKNMTLMLPAPGAAANGNGKSGEEKPAPDGKPVDPAK
jgi:hypothetical protein